MHDVQVDPGHIFLTCIERDNNILNMPSKNTVKFYTENSYYHLYNRGVEKRDIFLQEEDCAVFLRFLKMYLSPPDELKSLSRTGLRVDKLIKTNMFGEIELVTFSLMPNHFHLLVKQVSKDGITKFMTRLMTAYVMYFNKKYSRVGPLFQGTYKGALVLDDPYILHLSRYIHLNPRKLVAAKINFKKFTSFPYFLGEKHASWVKPEFILGYFVNVNGRNYENSYKNFVEEYKETFDSEEFLGDLTLESD